MIINQKTISLFFSILGLSTLLVFLTDWFSQGFIRQANFRHCYQFFFIIIFSILSAASRKNLPKNKWLLIGCGIIYGTIVGASSMLLANLLVNNETTLHAIKNHGEIMEVWVMASLSILGGSSIIGGIVFSIIKFSDTVSEKEKSGL